MVALTCCGAVLVLVVVLCILWLSSVPPVPAIRRRLRLGRRHASSMLPSHLKCRITTYIPCCTANNENAVDPYGPGQRVTYEPEKSASPSHSEPSVGTGTNSNDYLDMNKITWPGNIYENIPSFSEAEQVQRWQLHFLHENEYLDPDDIQLRSFIGNSKSDPDESQS